MPQVPANPAVDDEEDQAPVPPKPLIGTTGGEIPEQASDVARRQGVQWSADPAARQAQIADEIAKRKTQRFQQEHPFTPTSWQPKPPVDAQGNPVVTHEDRQFTAQAENQAEFQQQAARAKAVDQRRQQIEAQKTANDQLEAQYRGSGQQFYTDAHGRIQPVIEQGTNRPLFHKTGWQPTTHPDTGKPTLMMRDQYGQRQFKEAPVVPSLDPTDDQMYYKMPDGTTSPAGSIDQFAQHPNYQVAKAALAAKTRQVKAIHQQALQPIKLLADQAASQLEDAKAKVQSLDSDIEKTNAAIANAVGADGSPTPLSEGLTASLQQMQQQRETLDAQTKPRGELARNAARARAGYTIASATAMREAFTSQQNEIAARVKAQGGKLENDPTYQANLKGMQSANQILQSANGEFDGVEQPTSAPVGQDTAVQPVQKPSVLEQSEPFAAAQQGVTHVGAVPIKEFARRYGDGTGPVQPDSLIKLYQRSKDLDATLSNAGTTVNQTMRDQIQKEKDYVESLVKQRFARLPEDQQKKVADTTRDPTWWDKIKGAGKSVAEEAAVGGGAVLKGLAQAGAAAGPRPQGPGFTWVPTNQETEDTYRRLENRTPQEKMEATKNDPIYKLGTFIQDAAHETYSKNPHEDEGAVSKALNAAAGAAGGFAPLIASGPAAPLTVGLQTAGDDMQRIYDEQIKKGVDKNRAADFAQKRALASGAVQAVLFELLPKPLQKVGNKIIVDKIAGNALKKFLADRIAQGTEGAVIGGATAAAKNVTEGRAAGEGVSESAAGLGIAQALLPRAGFKPEEGGKPAAGAPEPTPSPEQQAAEAEFQKRLTEPAEPPKPSTAAESAQTFEPALKEKANTPPPAKSAEESAKAIADVQDTEEASTKVAAQQEAKAQKLVDQIQEATGKPRDEILATRKGRDVADWSKELETEAKYQKSPLTVDPDRRISELKADLKKLDSEWAAHRENVAANAERLATGNSQADVAKSTFEADKARHDSLMERRDAIEQQLTEAQRVRQSPKGAEDLKADLAKKAGGGPPPEEPGAAPASKPEGPKTPTPASADIVARVSRMKPDEVMAWAHNEAEGGPTGESDKLGISAIGKPDRIAEIEKAHEAAQTEWKAANDIARSAKGEGAAKADNDAHALSAKVQFFSEALAAAKNTGSAIHSKEVQAAHAEKGDVRDLLKGENFDKEWKKQGGHGGSENQVIFKNGKAYKRNYDPIMGKAVPIYGSIKAFNEHVSLHNELFPSAKITHEGVSETSDGPAPVISQTEIKGVSASPKEIRDYMAERGFKPSGGDRFFNEKTGIEVSDLRKGNVLKDAEGELHVIDPVVKRISKSAESKPKSEEPSNAIPKQSSGEVSLRETPQSSEGVRGENTVDKSAPAARETESPGGVSKGGGGRKPSLRENGDENRNGKTGASSEAKNPPPVSEVAHEIKPPKDAAPISAGITDHTPETVTGGKLNKNWTAFDKDSGTLGVPRAEMPQIKSEHRGAMAQFLRGRGIATKAVMVRPGDLKPTQAEFSPEKVQAAREFSGSERPILISSDGHVIDGHHQWMAGLQDDSNTPMPAIKLDAPVDKLLAEIKEFPSAETKPGIAAKSAAKEPTVAAPATKRLSDRAIDALQKAKIDTKGKLFDVTQGAYITAHNAALDLAILGVRAGRALNDVIKLAVDRFKAKFPDHTPEHIDKLESDIRAAVSPKPDQKPAAVAKTVLSSKPQAPRASIMAAWNKASSEGDLKKTLATTRDAADNLAATTSDEAHSSVANELSRAVPKEEQKIAADALSFHIEAGDGGVAALKAMREKIATSEKASPKWKERALAAIDYAAKNYENLKSTSDLYRQFTDQQVEQEQAAGMPTLKRDNYVMHAQDVDEGGWLSSGGGMSPTGSSSRKNRTFDTFADSIAAGIDPKSLNAADLLRSRVRAGQTGINLRQWQDSLKNYVDPTSKQPIATKPERIERADGSFYYQPPKGYKNEMLNGTPISVKDEYAGTIGALTDPSWWSKTEGRRLVQKLNGAGKSINLLIDTFHLGRLALRQSILKSASVTDPRLPIPSYTEGKTILEHSPVELTKMAKNGEIDAAALPDLLEKKKNLTLLTAAGLNIGHVADAMHQEMVSKLPVLGEVNKFIFQKFQRGAMSEAALMEYERQSKSYPELTPVQVARKVASDLNTRFGNLGRQGIFKSRTAQDIARLIWLAPQWNEGLIRSELGGVGQIGKSVADAITGKRIAMGALGRDMIAGTVGLFVANQIINQVTRGKFTWENPEEGWGSKLSAWIPDKVGSKGSGFFLNPLGITAEISHQLLNAYERKDSTWDAVKDFAKSRSSAAARPFMTWLTGKDALGGNIRTGDMGKEILKSAAPVPIGGSAAVSALRGISNGGNTETYPGQFQKQVMQSFGLKTETAPSPEQRIQDLAKKFKAGKGIEPSAEFYAGDYADLTNALRRNNPKDIAAEIKNLLEKKSLDEIRKHYQSWGKTPFTGQRDREAEFIRTLNPEQRSIYTKAQQGRLAIGSRALSAVSHTPPAIKR